MLVLGSGHLEVTTFDSFTAYWTDRGWSEQGPVKHGIGMALHTWGGMGSRPNDVEVTISSDGSVLVRCSTQDLGTGERTVLPIIVAEVLGLSVKDVTVRIGERIIVTR